MAKLLLPKNLTPAPLSPVSDLTGASLNPKYIRNLISNFGGVDIGSGVIPPINLNDYFVQYGIMPVVLAQDNTKPLFVRPLGFWNGGTITTDAQNGPISQTLVNPASISASGNGTSIYTVTTGKTLYITAAIVGNNNGSAKTVGLGGCAPSVLSVLVPPSNTVVFPSPVNGVIATCPSAGTVTVTTNSGANDAYAWIAGYEQ